MGKSRNSCPVKNTTCISHKGSMPKEASVEISNFQIKAQIAPTLAHSSALGAESRGPGKFHAN